MQPSQTIFTPVAGGAKKATYTGTAGTTVALNADATAVWVVCTTDAFVRVNGTAVADQDAYVVAFIPALFSCPGGATVSAVQVTAAGTLYACPVI